MKYLNILLIFIPVTIAGKIFGLSDTMLFACSSLAIVPLAGLMGKSTDIISCFCGQKLGGLLNATFGNATELIIAFIAMKEGMVDVVKASLAGSVIGNILLAEFHQHNSEHAALCGAGTVNTGGIYTYDAGRESDDSV